MKQKYWYFTRSSECVLCGATDEYKFREYSQKPKDPIKRIEFIQFACDIHFI